MLKLLVERRINQASESIWADVSVISDILSPNSDVSALLCSVLWSNIVSATTGH